MTEADQHLLNLVTAGDHDGWQQLVARFQKRLMAFAVRQVDQHATAEDLVQETFVAFLNAMSDFRQHCELESFLFQILRRRIVDHYRRQGRNREVPACSFSSPGQFAGDAHNPLQRAEATEMHASWYVRRKEADDADGRVLANAIRLLADKLQSAEKFRDLKIAEGLFYAGRRNQELAAVLNVSENEIALVKHRLTKRLAQLVSESEAVFGGASRSAASAPPTDSLLTSVWETERPSCPKRTTLGKFILGILPADWNDFVQFHVHVLGCSFCAANLDELSLPDGTSEVAAVEQRLFTSTVGFLKR